MNIKNKLTLTMVSVFLIVVMLLGYVYLSSMKSSLDIKASEDAARTAYETDGVLTRLFNARLTAIRSSAEFLSRDVSRDSLPSRIPILQYSMALSEFECYALKWHDKWCNVSKAGYSEKQPSIELAGKSDSVIFDSLYEDDPQGLLFIQSIYDNNETEIGLIVAKMTSDILWNEINATEALANDDVIISKPTGEILFPRIYAGGQLIAQERNNVGQLEIISGGRTVSTMGMTIPVLNDALDITVCVNHDSAIQSYNRTLFLIVMIAVIGVLLIGTVVHIAVSKMTRSITELAGYVAQMETEFDSFPESFTNRRDEAGRLANSFALLLTRLKWALDEKDFLARHDSLTNLENRYCLEHNIIDLIEKQRPFAYGLLDLDDFKIINDTKGHDEGDKLLKNLAAVFKSFKPEELTAYRWGGDEFALLIFGDSMEQYEKTLQVVMQRIKDRFSGEDATLVTVSIGVSMYPESASTYKNLLIAADKALAWAKMTGKVNFCFYRK